ncbi:c-type cytochrome [Anianabacter salinae]|uniref:c-type cytochrome n=1 Tax=Anianabacter salinae TaxID=2851023 RepID=UPI00225E3D0F|nr:cytochrome c [Anianabacter salinae]MBV0913716.1 cytochrome c [Anianabacter salinae]
MIRTFAAVFTICAVTVAVQTTAQTAVQNPAVKARMDLMGQIASNTKVLGDMAKAERPFDAAAAQAAAAAIAAHAARIPAAFEAQETDPESEALPVIWTDFAGFTARSEALRVAATGAASSITSPDTLRSGLGGIGRTCGACHETFRE